MTPDLPIGRGSSLEGSVLAGGCSEGPIFADENVTMFADSRRDDHGSPYPRATALAQSSVVQAETSVVAGGVVTRGVHQA